MATSVRVIVYRSCQRSPIWRQSEVAAAVGPVEPTLSKYTVEHDREPRQIGCTGRPAMARHQSCLAMSLVRATASVCTISSLAWKRSFHPMHRPFICVPMPRGSAGGGTAAALRLSERPRAGRCGRSTPQQTSCCSILLRGAGPRQLHRTSLGRSCEREG